ncbi:MAG TPA: trehalose-phosphatase [Gammaproteobacteria bacterium]
MMHLFSPAGMAELGRFSGPGTLLGLDYDGTLAPITANPDEARIPSHTRACLERAASRYPTVVITGRAVADARRLLSDLPVEIIGNHGAEGASVVSRFLESRVASWRDQLASQLAASPGISVEDKRYSLAIHYRSSPDWTVARDLVMRAVSRLPGARVVPGKAVVNVLLHEAPNKGSALLVACARVGCARAIYIGDDETDEDIFSLNRPDQVLGIRVGNKPDSSAAFYVESQDEVDGVFSAILAASH